MATFPDWTSPARCLGGLGASLGIRRPQASRFNIVSINRNRNCSVRFTLALCYFKPLYPLIQIRLAKMLVSLTVGKVDAGVAVLLTQDNRLVGPRSATMGYPLFLHITVDKEDPCPLLLPCARNTKRLFQL